MTSPDDREELAELNNRSTADIIASAKSAMDAPCKECRGAKLMEYLIIARKPAPWYRRLIGQQVIEKRRTETGVPCHRCGGSGTEGQINLPLTATIEEMHVKAEELRRRDLSHSGAVDGAAPTSDTG